MQRSEVSDIAVRVVNLNLLVAQIKSRCRDQATLAKSSWSLFSRANRLRELGNPILAHRYVYIAVSCCIPQVSSENRLMLADEIFASELGGRATTSARAIEELLTEIATGLLGFNQWMGLSLGLCSQGEFVAGHLAYQYAR